MSAPELRSLSTAARLAATLLVGCTPSGSALNGPLGPGLDAGEARPDLGPGPGDLGPADSGPVAPPARLTVEVWGEAKFESPGARPAPIADAFIYLRSEFGIASAVTGDDGLAHFGQSELGSSVDLFVAADGHAAYAAFGVSGPRWVARLGPPFLRLEEPRDPTPTTVRGDASDALTRLGPSDSFRELSLRPFLPASGASLSFVSRGLRTGVEGLPGAERLRFRDTAFAAPAFGVADGGLEAALPPVPMSALVAWGNDRSNDSNEFDPSPDAVAVPTARRDGAAASLMLPTWTRLDQYVQVDLRNVAEAQSIRKLWAPSVDAIVPIGEIDPVRIGASAEGLRFPFLQEGAMAAVEVTWGVIGARPQTSRVLRFPVSPEEGRARAPEPVLSTEPPTVRLRDRTVLVSLDPGADLHRLELRGPTPDGGAAWTLVVTSAGRAPSYALSELPPAFQPLPPASPDVAADLVSIRARGHDVTELESASSSLQATWERVSTFGLRLGL